MNKSVAFITGASSGIGNLATRDIAGRTAAKARALEEDWSFAQGPTSRQISYLLDD